MRKAQFTIKCDFLKGYRAVHLPERAKKISVFLTLVGAYQYQVMPFGMRNSQATFVRLMCLAGIPSVDVYINDIVIFSNTWEEQVETIEKIFQRLMSAKYSCKFVVK